MKTWCGPLSLSLVLASVYWALWLAPQEELMGEVYRIIYFHVPSAFAAFSSSLALFLYGITLLRGNHPETLLKARAICEVGLLYTILTLATGSIWGKPTWGTWWTWDARLTTTLLLGILYAGWLILHTSMNPGPERHKVCGILAILIFADVPIIYGSVNWWRTLHQPQSILRPGGSSTMDPEMRNGLIVCIAVHILYAAYLSMSRYKNLRAKAKVEELSLGLSGAS